MRPEDQAPTDPSIEDDTPSPAEVHEMPPPPFEPDMELITYLEKRREPIQRNKQIERGSAKERPSS